MLKLIQVIFYSLSAFVIQAQGDSLEPVYLNGDRPGSMWYFTGLRPENAPHDRKYDRLIFDITYTDWLGDLEPFNNKWNSIGLNTSFMFDIPMNKKGTVSFGTGISHSFHRVSYYNNFEVDSTNSFTQYIPYPSSEIVKNRFLAGNTFSVPFELRYRNSGWRHFKLHLGGKIGYQLNLFSKVISEGQNGGSVLKENPYPDIYRLIYSAHVRIGIRNWALFGSYNFNPVFSHKQSTKLNFFQMGFSVSLF